MNQILTILALAMLAIPVLAQDEITTQLDDLIDKKEFKKIIADHADKATDYPAKALYNIGLAYYMLADDNNCLKFMDLAIAKDANDPSSHFIKAMTYNYMGQFEKAIKNFDNAIKLDGTNAEYHSGLGDAYFSLKKFEPALKAYQNATEQEDAPDRPYTMIPQAYTELKQTDKALEAFYIAKGRISKKTTSYITVLYNIGLNELLAKNYDKAELALKELIEISPTDYQSYTKLIQIHYGRKEYDKAEEYKKVLYKAHEQGLLKDNLKTMYCFDQFDWNDKLIQVFERYAEPEGELYYKHLFYVVNKDAEIEYRIQTEYSPVTVEQGGPKYMLGMTKGSVHSTFPVGFAEDFLYEDLKKAVIKVLDGKITPGSSSRPVKN